MSGVLMDRGSRETYKRAPRGKTMIASAAIARGPYVFVLTQFYPTFLKIMRSSMKDLAKNHAGH
jgi:hypothetical protein